MADGQIAPRDAMLHRPAAAPRFLDVEAAKRLIFALRQGRDSGVVAQLVAANAGEGTSSLSRDLALVAATVGLQVLLLTLDASRDSQLAVLSDTFRLPVISTATIKLERAELQVHRLGLPGLHVAEPDVAIDLFQASARDILFQTLRQAFDLVIIDSAPMSAVYDSIARASSVDTNILVVRAGLTRIAVVQTLQTNITEVGGRIAGVIFNRRRFYVPESIYRFI